MDQGTVVSLIRYPVSSMGGELLDSAAFDVRGIVGDRRFGLFETATGTHIYPARDGRWNAAPRIDARMLGEGVQLGFDGTWLDADDPALGTRIAGHFGLQAELRAYDPSNARRYKLAPLHLLSLQSMETLRRLLPGSLLDERRFRPNIVVDLPGLSGEIPEYGLLGQEFTLGGLRLRGTVPCGRCGFTTLPIHDLPEDPGVLRTLVKQFERNFGIYCEVLEGGEARVGDVLRAEAPRATIEPVLIVGGGQAGAMAARALRRHGYAGRIRLYGAERHAPYERPPLSKQIGGGGPSSPVLSAVDAEAQKITLHLGTTVEAVDLKRRRIELADGSEAGFGTLILATGGMARKLPDLDRGHGRVHVLRTQEDADRLALALRPGARLFVMGGGWIGMEAAATARKAGAEVTLFARTTRLAPRLLPPVVADHIAAMHRARGVSLRFGTDPRFVEHANGVRCAIGSEVSEADHLIVAIGMVAQDGLARRAGLACDDGILTDACGATADPSVYAIGDVSRGPAGRMESWQNANLQADRAARRILGIEPPPDEMPRFWSDQFGSRIQIAGLPDPSAPLLSTEDGPFWDFGAFAIGIDRPERIHRFARVVPAPTATQAAAAVIPRQEHVLCLASDVAEGTLLRMDHPARGALAVTRQGGRVFATDDRCPHSVASLSAGFVEGGRIVCPLHFAEFGLEDGRPHHAPDGCGSLVVHPVREEGGMLHILLPLLSG